MKFHVDYIITDPNLLTGKILDIKQHNQSVVNKSRGILITCTVHMYSHAIVM